MRDTKLILLEGLSGSGKSTTATYLALQLQRQGIPYRYHWEMEVPHPVNMRTGFGDSVYTPEERFELGLAKWRAFAAGAAGGDQVTILDGKPLHITLLYMILHDSIKRERLVDYARQIAAIIRPLGPRLVYLRQEDLELGLQHLERDRGTGWSEGLIAQIQQRQADKSLDFSGRDGLLRYFAHYRDLLESALAGMDTPALRIEVQEDDWPARYRKLHAFLGLDDRSIGDQRGNRHLMDDEGEDARLRVANRTDRSLIAYRWPSKGRFSEYAFELAPRDARVHTTQIGARLRLHDTNSGEILRDVIVAEAEQHLKITDINIEGTHR